jgi:uncharacterized protein (DUF1684 family)
VHKILSLFVLFCIVAISYNCWGDDYSSTIRQWQKEREDKLRAANGWLSLVARIPLSEGRSRFGVGESNEVRLPESLKAIGPPTLGFIDVNRLANTVTLHLKDDVVMKSGEEPFTGSREFRLKDSVRDWVSLGSMSMHVIERDGRYFLRVADSDSEVRLKFPGCKWFEPDERFKVTATFIPYTEEKALSIVNIAGEMSSQPCPGYAEFSIDGVKYQLDAIQEGQGLFFVFRDGTAGVSTYAGGRFIDIETMPAAHEKFVLDFNKAYNPPCAFSKYTTCPLPPPQNVLDIRIEAGEKLEGAAK